MSVYLALSPVSVAVYGLLNVAGLTALATGGVYDDVPQLPTFPFVCYDVIETSQHAMGGGVGVPEISLRVHVYSTYAGMQQAQGIAAKVIELLRDKAITVSGYRQAGRVFYDETIPFPDEMISGVKCKEIVSMFRIYVEE